MIKLRELRLENNLTQKQIAQYLKTSQAMYAGYELGTTQLPVSRLKALCELYQVTADEVLGLPQYRNHDDSQSRAKAICRIIALQKER